MEESKRIIEEQKFEAEPTSFDKALVIGNLLFFPVFLPLGLWRFFRQYSLNYARGFQYGQLGRQLGGMYLGMVLYAFFVLYSDMEPSQRADQGITIAWQLGIVFLIFIAVLSMLRVHHNKQFYQLAKQYEDQIRRGVLSVEEIAAEVKQPGSRVIEDLKYLLNHKHFMRGIIKDGFIRLDANAPKNASVQPINKANNNRASSSTGVVTCSGCGSEVVIRKNQPVECAYCGSVMNHTG
ncbi:hypothetical protein [Paenibacillus ihbetae]|uniref:Uncharacterized protein n=1 Tax=Paenibacillus ihbetae TaxID=1870820 RepID=A0A1B2DXE1_9BACL|nr:hypothetical protein [Paenibacillus ihbetae]ANY72375.1 hypothetical protein BBD41_07160 [Paenibacillus ihbetae]OOC58285.1 hypothetical protein BBD40_21395 [Paenibacillus ihbetae]